MGKILRYVGIVAGVTALILGIIWLRREPILEASLESGISAATGVDAQIDRLRLRLFKGELTLEGLTLGNPDGFTTPYLLQINQLEVQLQLKSLLEDTVDIQQLELDGLDLNLEQNLAQNNLVAVINTLKESLSTNSSGGGGKKVQIDQLAMRDINADLQFSVLGGFSLNKTLEVPDIELTDVDSQNAEGKLVPVVTTAVITVIFEEIAKDITETEAKPNQSLPIPLPIPLPF